MNHSGPAHTTPRTAIRRALVASLTLTAFAVTATSTDAASAPRVLHVAHIDGGPIDLATGWFADALVERSGGALTAEIGFGCCGRQADVEQTLLERVKSAEFDLGWVGVQRVRPGGHDRVRTAHHATAHPELRGRAGGDRE